MINDENQDYEDDDFSWGSFRSADDLRKERLQELSGKDPRSLNDTELFRCIEASIRLEATIPAALDRLEEKLFVYLDASLMKDEWMILEDHSRYFQKHPQQARRFDLLKKRKAYKEDSRTWANATCGECLDGQERLKRLYESEEQAMANAEYRHRTAGIVLQAYRCPHTDGWHLTKSRS